MHIISATWLLKSTKYVYKFFAIEWSNSNIDLTWTLFTSMDSSEKQNLCFSILIF